MGVRTILESIFAVAASGRYRCAIDCNGRRGGATLLVRKTSRELAAILFAPLLLLVTAAASAFAWVHYERSQSQQEQQLAAHLGSVGISLGDEEYFGPAWLLRFLSDDQLAMFYHFTSLDTGFDLPPSEIDNVWDALCNCPASARFASGTFSN